MKRDKLQVLIFCVILVIFPLMTLFQPKSSTNFYENRALAPFPTVSIKAVLDRSFFTGLEDYFSNHIYQRETLLRAGIAVDMRILKRPQVENTVLAGDLLLPLHPFTMPSFKDEDMALMVTKLAELNHHVAENGGRFLYVGVPEQSSIFYEKYPSYVNNNHQRLADMATDFWAALTVENVHFLDMGTVFTPENAVDFYAKTDHHYTMQGAYETYAQTIAALNQGGLALPRLEKENIVFYPVDSPFLGSRNRRLYGLFPTSDTLYSYTATTPVAFTRFDNGKEVASTLFAPPSGEMPLTYSYYMGGDVANTVLKAEENRGLPKVLLVGDSFTNPFEGLLLHSFDEVHTVDLRHYKDMTLFEYIAKHKPDVVLCLRDDLSYLLQTGNGTYR